MKSTSAQRLLAAGESSAPGYAGLPVPRPRTTLGCVAWSAKILAQGGQGSRTRYRGSGRRAVGRSGREGSVRRSPGPGYRPVAVICRLLGVPLDDEPEFRGASGAAGPEPGSFHCIHRRTQGFDERLEAGLYCGPIFGDLLQQRRRAPADDLMSALIAVESPETSSPKMRSLRRATLLIAGHETTVNHRQRGVGHVAQTASTGPLADDSERASGIVEETLRLDPAGAIGRAGRRWGHDSRRHWHPQRDNMMLLLAAPTGDPAVVDRPGEFDPLGLDPPPRFRSGGALLSGPLARLEAAVALSAVTKRFSGAQLAAEPVYKPHVTLRGMASLEVSPLDGLAGRSTASVEAVPGRTDRATQPCSPPGSPAIP